MRRFGDQKAVNEHREHLSRHVARAFAVVILIWLVGLAYKSDAEHRDTPDFPLEPIDRTFLEPLR